jgi:ankyrin repeat protein
VTDKHQQLIQAIIKDDAHRVKLLLHEDPTLVRARDTEGRTPILLALYFGHEALAHVIREKTPDPDLFEAVALGDTELLKGHLAKDAGMANAVAQDGFGVLGLASFFGRIEAAALLMEAGADPNTPSANDFKVRPIHSAAANRSAETSLPLCKILLEGGADPNVAQAGGWTPLHQAATHGRMKIVQLLLEHGAKVDIKSDDDRTAADMAKVKEHAEIQALLEKAAG